MPESPSCDPNTGTEYHSTAASGDGDLKGLLVRLQTLHMESPFSTSRLDGVINYPQKLQFWNDCYQAREDLKKKNVDPRVLNSFSKVLDILNRDDKKKVMYSDEIKEHLDNLNKTIEFLLGQKWINEDKEISMRSMLWAILVHIKNCTSWIIKSDPGNQPRSHSVRSHTNTSHEHRKGSFAWTNERGLYYVKDNETIATHVPWVNGRLPRSWQRYSHNGSIYFQKNNDRHKYIQIAAPNAHNQTRPTPRPYRHMYYDPYPHYPYHYPLRDSFLGHEEAEHFVDHSLATLECDEGLAFPVEHYG